MKVGSRDYTIIGNYLNVDNSLFIKLDTITRMEIYVNTASSPHSYIPVKSALILTYLDSNTVYTTEYVRDNKILIELAKMIASKNESVEII